MADSKMVEGHELFNYVTLYILAGFSFEKFLECLENGVALVDFDARTGHNHGTKFRIRQGHWRQLYSEVEQVI